MDNPYIAPSCDLSNCVLILNFFALNVTLPKDISWRTNCDLFNSSRDVNNGENIFIYQQ